MGYLKSVLLFIALLVIGLCFSILVLFQWGNTSLNRKFLNSFGWVVKHVVGLKIKILNEAGLTVRRPVVFACNHQTGLDLAIAGTLCPAKTVVIAKKELLYIPFFGWFFKGAGNLLIDRANAKQAKNALSGIVHTLKEKNLNIVIMPEGTRNKNSPDEMLPFKKGAFHLAIESGFPIVPVVTSSLKGIAIWENFELAGGDVVMSVLNPIETKHLKPEDTNHLMAEVRNVMALELKRINQMVRT